MHAYLLALLALQLSHWGVDASALGSSPCSLQLVLLPYGEEKQDLDEYSMWEVRRGSRSLDLDLLG